MELYNILDEIVFENLHKFQKCCSCHSCQYWTNQEALKNKNEIKCVNCGDLARDHYEFFLCDITTRSFRFKPKNI